MPKIAYSKSLDDYLKLGIKNLKDIGLLTPSKGYIDIPYQSGGFELFQRVNIDQTPCNYGGQRYWFSCPKCKKKVTALYKKNLFMCRHCIGSNYKSQLEAPFNKSITRINQLRARLKWPGGIAHGYGVKPKGMHSKTYARLLNEYLELEKLVDRQISLKVGLLSKNFEKIEKQLNRYSHIH